MFYNSVILFRGVAQFGRALGLGPRGRRFKSGRPDFGGYSLVVELLPSKQARRVRFPLPALWPGPIAQWQSGRLITDWF